MKVVYNSTGYQMVEQRRSWKGPDTINVYSVGNTDHGSILIQKSETRLYANRTDNKIIIERLTGDLKMSNNHSEGIEEFSKFVSRNIDYIKYKFGSNIFPGNMMKSVEEEENNR